MHLDTRETLPQNLPAHEFARASLQVDGAQFTARWQTRTQFVVLDTGFGLGLKFLATWQAWQQDPQRPQHLHYIAFESRPYSATVLQEAHQRWPELAQCAQELHARWPLAVPGFHRILFFDSGITLTLIFGVWQDNLPQLDAHVDAFLIAPDETTLRLEDDNKRWTWFARLAATGATVSLPAGENFDPVKWKTSGFIADSRTRQGAIFAPRWKPEQADFAIQRNALVIGAGLAGSAICERLTARGWQVTLIEQHAEVGQEASGNLAGVFMPLLARDDNPAVRLSRAAFLFAVRMWQQLGGIGVAFDGAASGVLHIARDAAHRLAARELAALQHYPARFAQYDETREAWFFQQGGWANPASVCNAMLSACGNRVHRLHEKALVQLQREDGQWHALDARGTCIAQAPHVVIANGRHGNAFAQTRHLPLAAVRGQVTHVPAALLPEIAMPLCSDGYVTPAYRDLCSVGATYDNGSEPGLRMESQQENIARLSKLFPLLELTLRELPLQGRVGFRCVSPDRLPLVGALPDYDALEKFRGERLRDVPRHAGLYGLLAYASRGLTWAPLAAELLAAQMSGEPLPLERELCATLDPARFVLQELRKTRNAR